LGEVVVAPVLCRAVATTVRVKKSQGASQKLLLLMLLQKQILQPIAASTKLNPNSGLTFWCSLT